MGVERQGGVPRKHKVAMAIAALLLISVSGGAAPAREEAGPNAETRTIIDMRGREVEIPAEEVNRVIGVRASSLRLLTYLDAVEKVVAVEDAGHGREKTVHEFFHLATYRIAYPELRELPSIGSSESHEEIIAAEPQVVFSATADVAELNRLQETLAIPVVAVDADVEFYDMERFVEQLEMLGTVLGREDRAQELAERIGALISDLEARADSVGEPRTGYAGGMMFYGPANLLRTTGDYFPFDYTGMENVMPTNPAGNRQPYMTSVEELIEADPQYIFIDAANADLSRTGYRDNRAALDENVTAFANRDVYTTLVYKYYGTNWENQLINAYYVGTVVYPELFQDIVIEEKTEEIWRLFFNVPVEYHTATEHFGTGLGRVDWR